MSNLVYVTLADLQALAIAAEHNGTLHAFSKVALQWCEAAQTEIMRLNFRVEQLQEELNALRGR